MLLDISRRLARSRTRMQLRQLSKNLFLNTKWGGHAPLLNGAPQQAEQHSISMLANVTRSGASDGASDEDGSLC